MSEQTSFCTHRPLPKPELTRESYDEDWNLKSEQDALRNEVARLQGLLKDTTDTPRTDEEIWTTDYHHELCDVVDKGFAQQLEMELKVSLENQVKAQAEIERLREEIEIESKRVTAGWDEIARLRQLLKDHATFLRKNGFDRQADDLIHFVPKAEIEQTS